MLKLWSKQNLKHEMVADLHTPTQHSPFSVDVVINDLLSYILHL